MRTHKELVNEIIINMNWAKIHSVMKHLNWTWISSVDGGVPTVGLLVSTAQESLYRVIQMCENSESGISSIGCGGFEYRASKEEDGCINLELYFVVAEWSAC